MGFILFNFVQVLLCIKSKNWNKEILSYTQKTRSLAYSLTPSGMKSPGRSEITVLLDKKLKIGAS
jgi:hypothetical protein